MLQRILDIQNEDLLAQENSISRAKETLSSIESLNQKFAFFRTSNDSFVENMVSNGELIMESDDVLPMVCDAFVGDCELKVDEGEDNVECLIEVSSLQLNAYCCEQVEILTSHVQNPPGDFFDSY